MKPLEKEEQVIIEFNKLSKTNAGKRILVFGESGAKHEFDIYEKDKVIGGVSTSPWRNKANGSGKRTNNTSGQDRASTELLWLSLWQGPERRVHILTDDEMAKKLFQKFNGSAFQQRIEIYYFNAQDLSFLRVGIL